MKQGRKYKQHRQPDDSVHMDAECPLVQVKSGVVIHAEYILKEGYHKDCEIAPEEKRIQEIDGHGGGDQHGNGAEANFYSKLAKILVSFTFQWCIQPPILFL